MYSGVRKITAGRCLAPVVSMISAANELASISAAEVHALDARQVVQAVAVLQALQLGLEDEVEGRAEQAAEQVLLLGQAADPQIDVVETGDRARAPVGVHRQRIVHVVGVGPEAVHEVVGVLVPVLAGRRGRRPAPARSAAARLSASVVAPTIEACVP